MQGNRLLELLDTMPDFDVYLMNTGAVGGPEGDANAVKVKIAHSSAILEAIISDTITWVTDPDFGYEVAAEIPGFADSELLRPRLLYERQGRLDEYASLVARLKTERREYLHGFPGLAPEIVEAV